ncbi:MAG TPA: LapA family protein [Chloroflexaceae bacterium]|nr:LapA family protein [Chloroflexaceae bacterium]
MQTITRALIGILAAALAIGLVIFGVQNTGTVQIQFLGFATQAISVSLLVIGAFILGAAMMWLLGLYGAAQRSLRHRRDAKERATLAARNKELEQKVAGLERELGSFKPAQPAAPKAAEKPAAKP